MRNSGEKSTNALSARRVEVIRRRANAERRRHGASTVGLSLADLCAICEARSVQLSRYPLPHPLPLGFAALYLGAPSIVLATHLRGAAARWVLAHEIGHVLLGHLTDPRRIRGPAVGLPGFHLGMSSRGDQLELEADLFASTLLRISQPPATIRNTRAELKVH